MNAKVAKHPVSNLISQSLSLALNQDFEFTSWTAVAGGSIHQAWSVTTACNSSFFIKTNQASKLPMFEAEAAGLQYLSNALSPANPLSVPDCFGTSCNETYAWIIMAFVPLAAANSEAALGRGLALLHLQSQQPASPCFGLAEDNFIGDTPQPNQQSDNWLNFFSQQRLTFQLQLAKEHGFYGHLADEARQLLKILPQLLQGHDPKPSLLHGDLWSGNKGYNLRGDPVIFDPAIYYGDRECDLAMTELFGGFSPEFYQAYDDIYPITEGYQQRKQLYNLYHILNHANLFGGHYIQQSKSMMQQLLQRV